MYSFVFENRMFFLFNRNTDRKVSVTDPQGRVVKCVEIKFLVNCVQHIELLTIMCTSIKHDQITLSYRVFLATLVALHFTLVSKSVSQ